MFISAQSGSSPLFATRRMDNGVVKKAYAHQFYQQQTPPKKSACIMDSIDPCINSLSLDVAGEKRDHHDGDAITASKLESLNILGAEDFVGNGGEGRSFLLFDEHERLRVANEIRFLERLGIRDDVKRAKVVSIFGNTGVGKSYTLNKTFFEGETVFRTSPEQTSCTLGVWAAFDPNLGVICLDTEGLLGVTKKENQRTRLLLKVLAVSDIVIYRTRDERLQKDMYTFLGGASCAFKLHFHAALQKVWQKTEIERAAPSLGPSVVIFHETTHTNTLQASAGVSESPEDILRSKFAELNMQIDAFSSLKYVGVQTKERPTSFAELRHALQLELENTTVRSPRDPRFVYLSLKGLNEKFQNEITDTAPQLYLNAFFTCQEKCQSCGTGCALSVGHVDDAEPHQSSSPCKFQHQYQNCIYLCKQCLRNGKKVVVRPSYQSITEKSWTSLLNYVWSGYIIECHNCGEIYRSRQHWYGNKSPEEGAVACEFVHVWSGERNVFASQNSAQRVLDGVTMITDAVTSVGSQPTKAITAWVTDKIAPSYWRPNNEIMHCHKCKAPFSTSAKKHHCRACGEGFCEECSSKYQPVPARGWYTDVRVCLDCYQESPPSLSQGNDDTEVRVRKYSEAVANSISAVASVLEIPKGIIKDTARPTYWTPDKDCLNCVCCGMPFGPIIPLHHCRDCGKGVCDDCSNSRKPVPWKGWDSPVRVCDNCLK